MNNSNIVYHLFSDFKVSWDIELILEKFIPELNISGKLFPFAHRSRKPHWQKFNTNISFARNFPNNFLNECKEVSEKLKKIQQEYKNNITKENSNLLVERFLKENINYKKVSLIKVPSQIPVHLHTDITRSIALNIGLKNSNTHITYVSDDLNIKNFFKSKKSSYTLQDGDGYLVSVRYPHFLDPLTKNDSIRYIITYNISF